RLRARAGAPSTRRTPRAARGADRDRWLVHLGVAAPPPGHVGGPGAEHHGAHARRHAVVRRPRRQQAPSRRAPYRHRTSSEDVNRMRTPDERFANLPGFPFAPHYVDVGGLRVHYVDEGPRTAAPVLMLHGEPSWCFLYRKMIPVLTAAGHRAVAPDLVGFGRSDKPERREDYSYQRHVDWMRGVIEALDLRRITLV